MKDSALLLVVWHQKKPQLARGNSNSWSIIQSFVGVSQAVKRVHLYVGRWHRRIRIYASNTGYCNLKYYYWWMIMWLITCSKPGENRNRTLWKGNIYCIAECYAPMLLMDFSGDIVMPVKTFKHVNHNKEMCSFCRQWFYPSIHLTTLLPAIMSVIGYDVPLTLSSSHIFHTEHPPPHTHTTYKHSNTLSLSPLGWYVIDLVAFSLSGFYVLMLLMWPYLYSPHHLASRASLGQHWPCQWHSFRKPEFWWL